MTEQVLREYLGLRAPKVYAVSKNKTGIDPTLLYGVELEIEGLEADEDQRANRVVAGMQYHKDGSLRNNGGEFVTLPMNYANLEEVLGHFFKKNKFTEDNYSERCSVHVHANCQDLELDQIRLVLGIYQVLEKVLFNFIKSDRDKNIFCVPIGETMFGTQIMASAEALINGANRKWRKYTALNLLPLYSQGTLEFRHMAGTHNLEYILQWCDIIGCLFKYARENKFVDAIKSIQNLNTSSAYGTFMQSIFPGELYDLLAVGQYREYLEEGVINMKCMLATAPKAKKNPYIEDDWAREAVEAPINAAALQAMINQHAQGLQQADIRVAPGAWNAVPPRPAGAPPRRVNLNVDPQAIPAAPVGRAERDPRLGPAHWRGYGNGYQEEVDRENRERLALGLPIYDMNAQANHLTAWLQNQRAPRGAAVRNNIVNPQGNV